MPEAVSTASHLMNNYGVRTVEMVRGEGVYLFDSNGKQYLDYVAGIAVCSLGHAHPAITKTISDQAATLIHCSNYYEIPQQKSLSSKLAALSGLDKAFFCNSGTEANEAAIKLARKYAASKGEEQRVEIVSLPNAFHGRTLGSLSITPKAAYQAGYQPLLPGAHTPGNLSDVPSAITEKTAACFVEIIQGEGGVRPVDEAMLRAIDARCKEVGALLVVDEVQTGVGRTGDFYAYSAIGITPDIVTMAKGLGAGVPIGAVLAREEVAAAWTPGSHGSTFGGNPLATSVANTVVDIVSAPSFLEHVRDTGRYLEEALTRIGTEVTGRGLMWGFTVDNAKEYVANALQKGVLLSAVGESRVRLVPSLILEKEHVDELVERLSR